MTWPQRKGLPLNEVMFVCTAVFFCTLHQLAIGARLSESLPMSHIEEDFGKDSTQKVKEAEVDTGQLEKPLTATHELEHTYPATSKMHVMNHMDTTFDFKTSESLLLPNTSMGLEPPADPATPFPALALAIPSSSPAEFPTDLFSMDERRRGWVLLHILGMIYLFVALALVCNEFFVPAVAVFKEKLSISDDVAGATIMAAGRSIPKFLAFLVGILLAHSRVGIGTIVGATVYNIVFVIGMCALLARKILLLNWWPLFRDVSFNIFHLILLIVFFIDNAMMWWESMMLVGGYIAYVIFIRFDERIEGAFKTQLYKYKSIVKVMDVEHDKVDVPAGVYESAGSEDSEDEEGRKKTRDGCRISEGDEHLVREEEERREKPLSLKWPETGREQALYLLLLPIVLPQWLTVPDVRNQKSRKFFVITFLVSILWIIFLLYFILWLGHQVGETVGLPDHMIAILVGGAANPDLITSVIVARKGLGDMAVSSSMGSNIFDITVGLPVSWLLYSSIHGSAAVAVNSNGLVCASVLLFLMLLLVIILIPSSKWKMSKVLGFTMVLLYIIFLVISMMLQYAIIVCPVSVGDRP